MADEYDHLLGLITAHDLVLRVLVAQWAQQQVDPPGALTDMFETTYAQLRPRRADDTPASEVQVFEVAVEALKEFQKHVELRLQVGRP